MTVGYTYVVTHKPSGRRYYGCQWKKGVNPSNLWKSYFTSSKEVRSLIETDGKESFDYEIRKTFTDNPRKALEWEVRVLRRLNASKNPNWINLSNGHLNFNSTSIATRKRISEASLGKPKSEQHKAAMSRGRRGKKRRPLSEETKRKIGEINKTTNKNRTGMRSDSIRISCEGIVFKSIQLAVNHFECSTCKIRKRLQSQNFPNYYKLDTNT